MKKVIIVFVILLVLLIVALGGAFAWYTNALKPVDTFGKEAVVLEIPEGTGISGISKILEEKGIIRNADACKMYCKIAKVGNLQAGKYSFEEAKSVPEIIAKIASGDVLTDEIQITFIEGKNIRWYAKTIAENTINSEEEVLNLLASEEYIDSLIEKYWFLTDEIKDEDVYFPLEGYLLPDTYTFENAEVSPETIFNVILNFTDKFLSKYKDDFTYSVHQTLTLASMAEMEGKSTEDRSEIVGVFLNRIDQGMSLGSDVTTYYAFGVDMAENDLTLKQLNTYNPYNTRGPNMEGKIPIGPICNPSRSAIEATLNPTETDALYFVADKTGKVYFTKSNDEHNEIITKLKSEGKWYVYE